MLRDTRMAKAVGYCEVARAAPEVRMVPARETTPASRRHMRTSELLSSMQEMRSSRAKASRSTKFESVLRKSASHCESHQTDSKALHEMK